MKCFNAWLKYTASTGVGITGVGIAGVRIAGVGIAVCTLHFFGGFRALQQKRVDFDF